MQDSFARARDDRVSCIQKVLHIDLNWADLNLPIVRFL